MLSKFNSMLVNQVQTGGRKSPFTINSKTKGHETSTSDKANMKDKIFAEIRKELAGMVTKAEYDD